MLFLSNEKLIDAVDEAWTELIENLYVGIKVFDFGKGVIPLKTNEYESSGLELIDDTLETGAEFTNIETSENVLDLVSWNVLVPNSVEDG